MSSQKPQPSSAWDVLLALVQKITVQIFLFAIGFGILLIIGLGVAPQVNQAIFTTVIWAVLAIYLIAVVAYLFRAGRMPTESQVVFPITRQITQGQFEIQLVSDLIRSGILATSEQHSRGAVQKLDTKPPGFWTNLDIDFKMLNANQALFDHLIQLIDNYYLADVKEYVLAKPYHFKARGFTLETLDSIYARLELPLADSLPPSDDKQRITVIAGIYSPDLREFVSRWAQYIELVIVLLGPNLEYLSDSLGISPTRIRCLVSIERLMQIEPNVRSQMIGGY